MAKGSVSFFFLFEQISEDLIFILQVAEQIIPVIEEFNKKDPPMPLLISFDAEEVRKQAAASTKRFEEGLAKLHLIIYTGFQIRWGRVLNLQISCGKTLTATNHLMCFAGC